MQEKGDNMDTDIQVQSVTAVAPPPEPAAEEPRPVVREEPARPREAPAPQPEYIAQNVDLFA
jgi:hypothetical protein